MTTNVRFFLSHDETQKKIGFSKAILISSVNRITIPPIIMPRSYSSLCTRLFYLSHKVIYEAYFDKMYLTFTQFMDEINRFWRQSE